jgi:hypothetical protein
LITHTPILLFPSTGKSIAPDKLIDTLIFARSGKRS